MKTVQEIEAAVRTLSDDEYGLFRDWLCSFEKDGKIFCLHPEWMSELQRRINNLETGCAEGVPANQVFAEARALLHR